MKTLILDPPPMEVMALLARRKRAGLDRLDEVWEGVLHLVPAPSGEHADIAQQLAEILGGPARSAGLHPAIGEFNVGETAGDFRVPDGGIHRSRPRGTWFPTVALVVEIVSPEDETWEKLPFYAAHGVEEVLIVDGEKQSVHWLTLKDGRYQRAQRSALIEMGAAELVERIDWP